MYYRSSPRMFTKTYQFSRQKFFSRAHARKSKKCTNMRCSCGGSHCTSRNLNTHKPMNIQCLSCLTKVLNKSINVWSKDTIIYSCGNNSEPSIEVEYTRNDSKRKDGNLTRIGHFTLKNSKEASSEKIFPNDCLLRVISAQTGIRPNKLQREITRKAWKLKRNCFTKNHIDRSEVPVSIIGGVNADITGGARYTGASEVDAKRTLDRSQSGQSHPNMVAGHPRGHASYPQATEPTASVENYSKFGRKTGFFSRSDQDFVAHFVLKTNKSQDIMEVLNERGKHGIQEAAHIRAVELWVDEDKLPKIQEWHRGTKIGSPGRINDIVVVMKHYYQQCEDEDADVFILTLYPKL